MALTTIHGGGAGNKKNVGRVPKIYRLSALTNLTFTNEAGGQERKPTLRLKNPLISKSFIISPCSYGMILR